MNNSQPTLKQDQLFLRVAFIFDGAFNRKGQEIVRHKLGRQWPTHSRIQEWVCNDLERRLGAKFGSVKVVDATEHDSVAADSRTDMESLFEVQAKKDRLLEHGVRLELYPLRRVWVEHEGKATPRWQQCGVDNGITLHAYNLAVNKLTDVVVLVAGDGDFTGTVNAVQKLGVPVFVAYYTSEDWVDSRGLKRRGTGASRDLLSAAQWKLNLCDHNVELYDESALSEEDSGKSLIRLMDKKAA